MDYKLVFFLIVLIKFLLVSSSVNAYNNLPPNRPVSPDTICKFTPYPSSCKSLLPNKTANVYDYARFSVLKSLSQTFLFQSLLNKFLRLRAALPKTTVAALQDCQFLVGLNADYLSSSFGTINATSGALPMWKAEDVQTLLSAILTNQQTCYDGLQSAPSSWIVKKVLFVPLANDTKLFSVSLALFTKGWVPKKELATRAQSQRRVLLQTGDDQSKVVVRETVTVSQDGSGNFTTINDAVEAAPNNTAASDGYFVIYVKAGVYEEYVSIAKKKKYLMMIGDGINQTVVTGNRSVVDGWTTFKSATFGENPKFSFKNP
ncbi:Pectinesterase [Trema orientale]|uniref:pectinesterase n=1 Tax=Trema orientale TaxID=63057 RepID=A0A2P5CZ28_TREOI|nr:Pectinesterase [Trema orientale]